MYGPPNRIFETVESQATTAVHLDKGTAKIKLRGAVEKSTVSNKPYGSMATV